MTKKEFISKIDVFVDDNGIECVSMPVLIGKFGTDINLDDLYRMNWKYQDETGSDASFITLFDARLVVMLSEMGENLKDYEYSEIVECSKCGDILLPDDEAYTDVITSNVLCDTHSMFSEKLNGYIGI